MGIYAEQWCSWTGPDRCPATVQYFASVAHATQARPAETEVHVGVDSTLGRSSATAGTNVLTTRSLSSLPFKLEKFLMRRWQMVTSLSRPYERVDTGQTANHRDAWCRKCHLRTTPRTDRSCKGMLRETDIRIRRWFNTIRETQSSNCLSLRSAVSADAFFAALRMPPANHVSDAEAREAKQRSRRKLGLVHG